MKAFTPLLLATSALGLHISRHSIEPKGGQMSHLAEVGGHFGLREKEMHGEDQFSRLAQFGKKYGGDKVSKFAQFDEKYGGDKVSKFAQFDDKPLDNNMMHGPEDELAQWGIGYGR